MYASQNYNMIVSGKALAPVPETIHKIAVGFQLTDFSYDDCENIHTPSYYHHQIGNSNY